MVEELQRDLIYRLDWDILIILDACRADTFMEVALPMLRREGIRVVEFKVVKSMGSCTQEWFAHTFIAPIRNCIYLSNNPFISNMEFSTPFTRKKYCASKMFSAVIEVFRYSWKQIGFTKVHDPETLTNFALSYIRTSFRGKMIVHYVQPHYPYPFAKDLLPYITYDGDTFFKLMEKGIVDTKKAFEAYKETLRWVMQYVIKLVKSCKGKTIIITADHGEGFGEDGVYDHYCHVIHDVLRNVPWCRIET